MLIALDYQHTYNTIFSKLCQAKLAKKPKIQQKDAIKNENTESISGKITTIDPIVKPIILKKVWQ